jgi:hypothetical protein
LGFDLAILYISLLAGLNICCSRSRLWCPPPLEQPCMIRIWLSRRMFPRCVGFRAV